MAIGTNRVQVTKVESTALGGDDADNGPYGVDPLPIEAQEDAIETAGVYVQDEANRDELVGIFRSGDDLKFFDKRIDNSELALIELLGSGSWRRIEDITRTVNDGYDNVTTGVELVGTGGVILDGDGGVVIIGEI